MNKLLFFFAIALSCVISSQGVAEFEFVGTMPINQLRLAAFVLRVQSPSYGVKIYSVKYPSMYTNAGERKVSPTNDLSGLVTIPDTDLMGKRDLPASVFFHGTNANSYDNPSNAFEGFNCSVDGDFFDGCDAQNSYVATYSSLVASGYGYVGLAPDGIGYGSEFNTDTYPYIIQGHYANAGLSLLEAVNTWLEEEFDSSLYTEVVTGGYSEGGYASMAFYKSLSLKSSTYFDSPYSVFSALSGAAPLDLNNVQTCFFVQNSSTFPEVSYYLLIAKAYADEYNITNGLNPVYIDTVNHLLGGNYSSSLAGSTFKEIQNDPFTIVGKTERDELDAYCAGSLNYSDARKDGLLHYLGQNDLISGWEPKNNSVYLYHYINDALVLAQSTKNFEQEFPAAIVAANYATDEDCLSHSECGEGYITVQIKGVYDLLEDRLSEVISDYQNSTTTVTTVTTTTTLDSASQTLATSCVAAVAAVVFWLF